MRAPVAALVASLAAGLVSWPVSVVAVSPQIRSTPAVPDLTTRTPLPTWDTFSADVTIRRSLVRKDGGAGPAAPEVKYRWVRTLGEAGWKSTFTVVSFTPATIQTAKGPQLASMKVPVSRIEIGDPRTPTRVFDTAGRQVFMMPSRPRGDGPNRLALPGADATPTLDAALAPDMAAPDSPSRGLAGLMAAPADVLERAAAATRSRDWVEQLMPSVSGRGARRAAMARELGARDGSVNGLERFVSHAGGAMTEVLADPAWAVPVEINVVRDGALVSHSTLTYAEDPGAGLVRRRIRSEQLLSPESGDRAVIDFELANIRLDRGGAR